MIPYKPPGRDILRSDYFGTSPPEPVRLKPPNTIAGLKRALGMPHPAGIEAWIPKEKPLPVMNRRGAWVGDTFLGQYTSNMRPPGKKAREAWALGYVAPNKRGRRRAVDDWFKDMGVTAADDFMVRVDTRTGVAYTYDYRDGPPGLDELSPWRRGVIR